MQTMQQASKLNTNMQQEIKNSYKTKSCTKLKLTTTTAVNKTLKRYIAKRKFSSYAEGESRYKTKPNPNANLNRSIKLNNSIHNGN
jgi:hypothetical protein